MSPTGNVEEMSLYLPCLEAGGCYFFCLFVGFLGGGGGLKARFMKLDIDSVKHTNLSSQID